MAWVWADAPPLRAHQLEAVIFCTGAGRLQLVEGPQVHLGVGPGAAGVQGVGQPLQPRPWPRVVSEVMNQRNAVPPKPTVRAQ